MKKLAILFLVMNVISCSSISVIHKEAEVHEDHSGSTELVQQIEKSIMAFASKEKKLENPYEKYKPQLTLLGDEVDYTRGIASVEENNAEVALVKDFDQQENVQQIPLELENGTSNVPFVAQSTEEVLRKTKEEKILDPDRVLRFLWPLKESYRITSSYGHRKIRKKRSMHKGIDIGAKKGSSIVAAESGKVIYSGWMGSYGNVTIIAHNNDYHTVYAHASRNFSKRGELVEKGQTIAQVGSTGRSTGNHLHFEIRFDNKALDPMDFYQGLGLASNP